MIGTDPTPIAWELPSEISREKCNSWMAIKSGLSWPFTE